MPKPIAVKPLANFSIWLRYDDGVERDVDLSDLSGHGVFLAWNDSAVFRDVRLGSHGAIEWGPDIDLCPDAMEPAAPRLSRARRGSSRTLCDWNIERLSVVRYVG